MLRRSNQFRSRQTALSWHSASPETTARRRARVIFWAIRESLLARRGRCQDTPRHLYRRGEPAHSHLAILRPLALHRSFVSLFPAPSALSRDLPTCDNPQCSANLPRKANGPGLDRSANFRSRRSPQRRRHAQKCAVRRPVHEQCWPTPPYRLHGRAPLIIHRRLVAVTMI